MAYALWLYSDWLGQGRFSTWDFPAYLTLYQYRTVDPSSCLVSQASKCPIVISCQSPSWKTLSDVQGLVNRGLSWVWHWDQPGYGMRDQESIQYHQKHLNSWQEFVSACNKLGCHTFAAGDFSLFLWNMYTDLGLGLIWMVGTTSNIAGSGWKIVQSSVRLNQAKSKCCWTL